MLYPCNLHNIVHQLYFNLKKDAKIKSKRMDGKMYHTDTNQKKSGVTINIR